MTNYVWTTDCVLTPFFSSGIYFIRKGKKVNWKLIPMCLINGHWRMHSNLCTVQLFHFKSHTGNYSLLSPGVNVFVALLGHPLSCFQASFKGCRVSNILVVWCVLIHNHNFKMAANSLTHIAWVVYLTGGRTGILQLCVMNVKQYQFNSINLNSAAYPAPYIR